MNDMMKEILQCDDKKEGYLQIEDILEEIVAKTKVIRDCIIYDKDETLVEEKINFSRILQFVGDWTGYEVSCNEFRFERESIHSSQFLTLASKLEYLLSQKYKGKKIVVYISLYEDEIELRFHTYRTTERMWLDEDLNKYDTPILSWI